HPDIHSATDRGQREGFRELRQRRVEDQSAQEGGSEAEADQGEHRLGKRRAHFGRQRPRQSRLMNKADRYDAQVGSAPCGVPARRSRATTQGNRREAAEVTASHLFLPYLAVSSHWLTMGL